jgi:TPR repeat protein
MKFSRKALGGTRSLSSIRVLCCLALTFALALLPVPGEADPAKTNSPQRWPSLTEVKQKWANVSLGEIAQAADQGDLVAQHYLGYCYAEGFRLAKNPALGLAYYERAAKAGYLPSQNNLALMYQQGNGVPRDLVKAIDYYHVAISSGFRLAKVNLAWLYYQDEGRSDQALLLFKEAAGEGETSAMTALYSVYFDGRGVAVDRAEGIKWLTKAAVAGDAYGQCLLGAYYQNPRWAKDQNGLDYLPPPNLPEAVRWFRQSADQGWAGGQYHLGLCYLAGDGVEQDEDRGLELVRMAADQRQVNAEFDLADLYAQGIGVPRNDEDRPIALLKRVVQSKRPDDYSEIEEAYGSLVFRFDCGVGTERDVYAAVEWYCRAALAGVDGYTLIDKVQTVPRMRRSHEVCRGEPEARLLLRAWPECKNDEHLLAAVCEYLKAVTCADHAGLVKIGQKYVDGQGVPKSEVKAWLWFSLADAKGALDVKSKIFDIEKSMTEDQQKEAKRLLSPMMRDFDSVSAVLPSPPRVDSELSP